MVKLLKQNTSQSFNIIPRVYVADTLTLKNETTGVETEYEITPLTNSYFMYITATLDLTEDTFYVLKVFNNGEEVFRDRAFCTNQTDYSINEGQYVTYTTTNEFVVIS